MTHVTRELNITECTREQCYITHVTREFVWSGAYLCRAKMFKIVLKLFNFKLSMGNLNRSVDFEWIL